MLKCLFSGAEISPSKECAVIPCGDEMDKGRKMLPYYLLHCCYTFRGSKAFIKANTEGHISSQFCDINQLYLRFKANLDKHLRSEGADDPIN